MHLCLNNKIKNKDAFLILVFTEQPIFAQLCSIFHKIFFTKLNIQCPLGLAELINIFTGFQTIRNQVIVRSLKVRY